MKSQVVIILPWLYFTLYLTLLDSTLLYITLPSPYHSSTSHYLTLQCSTMDLLHSWWLYTLLYHGYTSIYYSKVVVVLRFYCTSTSLSLTLHYITMALLHSTSVYNGSCYFTLLDSTLLYHGSTSVYLTLHQSRMALLHSTWLYVAPPWLCLMLLDSTSVFHCSSSLYLNLLHSTIALLHSAWNYIVLPCMALLYSTWLYVTLPWLYFIQLDSTAFYRSLYFTLLDSTLH